MIEILDLIHYFEKYGPWGLLIGLFIALRRNRRLKRYINRHLPGILRSNGDSDLVEMKQDIKLIKDHLGIKEEGECVNTSKPCEESIQRNWFASFTLLQMKKFIVPFVLNIMNSRRRKKMTKDILSGKKKIGVFLLAVLINGLNDVLGLGLSAHTLDAATYLGGGYVAIEGTLDIIRSVSNHFLQKKQIVTTSQDDGIHYR